MKQGQRIVRDVSYKTEEFNLWTEQCINQGPDSYFFFFFEFMQQDVFPFIGEKKRLLWERGEGNEMG